MQSSNSSAEGLPMAWVEKLFEKLTMVYGHQFLGRWSGMDLNNVKADWSKELAGFERHGASIAHALKHLPPGDPPTVLQFRDLCRRAPEKADLVALNAPAPDPAKVAAAVSDIRQAMAPAADLLVRQREHMRMELSGIKLGARQREFWRIALRAEILSKYRIDTAQPFALSDLAQAVNGKRAA